MSGAYKLEGPFLWFWLAESNVANVEGTPVAPAIWLLVETTP